MSDHFALYLDPDAPIDDRVNDLISRMTLEEKISQMCNSCAAIPRLGIPAYDYWSEALHGVARNGKATVFPQAIGMAATWDPELIERVADAIATEARAKFHETLRKFGKTEIYQGLTMWSPNINIFRDPRWGRGQETWGEDPYLTGEMGAAFVRGLQGKDSRYLKTAACAKHYAVHSGPEKERHTFNAVVTRRELFDTYLPAFKKLVTEAKVETVMGAYNRTLGEPCCGSPFLLKDILRNQWGFKGHVVSDCGAISDFHLHHQVTRDGAESAALGIKSGCDMACICTYSYENLTEALNRGLITVEDLDNALRNTLRTRFKLGLFDPQEKVPYASIPMSVVGCEAHQHLAYETAVKSAVLLKNRNQILPIKPEVKSILIVGPNAGNVHVLLGNYYGLSDSMTTFLEGMVGRLPEGVRMEFMPGSLLTHAKKIRNDWSVASAASFDLVIAFMGLSPLLEGEEGEAILSDNGDREDISLPPVQQEYIRDLAATGARIVLVLTGGSPMALHGIENLVEAILWVGYPGQEGGKAVADLLFGNQVPSGRLPITFPVSTEQLPPFRDYSMRERTYRYMTTPPLFPFGFGLSYTRFEYRNLQLERDVLPAGETLRGSFTLSNVGDYEGEEVVQIYLSDLESSTIVPLQKLISFQRVRLKPGQSAQLSFTVSPESMMMINDEGKPVLEPGKFKISIGGAAPIQRSIELGAPSPVIAFFEVTG